MSSSRSAGRSTEELAYDEARVEYEAARIDVEKYQRRYDTAEVIYNQSNG